MNQNTTKGIPDPVWTPIGPHKWTLSALGINWTIVDLTRTEKKFAVFRNRKVRIINSDGVSGVMAYVRGELEKIYQEALDNTMPDGSVYIIIDD